MKTSTALFALSGLLLLTGACANPAADAPQAEVSEAPAAEPVATQEVAPVETATYNFTEDSSIGFVGSKVTGSHDGGFKTFTGNVEVAGDNPESVSVHVDIDTTSVWADDERLTGHLKSADFFDVETYPTASFHSTSVAANEDGTYTVTGTLDLHGVTKQITFPATITVDDSGVSTNAEFAIKRFDFGIEYPGKADDLIRDDVLIKLDLRAAAGDAAGDEEVDAAEAEEAA